MKFPQFNLSKHHAQLMRWGLFVGVALVLCGSSVVLALTLPQPPSSDVELSSQRGVHAEYMALVHDVRAFEDKQRQGGTVVVGERDLQELLARVRVDLDLGQFRQARVDMHGAQAHIAAWRAQLGGAVRAEAVAVRLPILMYHYTPPDFDAQLTHLEQAGYTVIELDEAWAGMHGAALPAKPVVITFDDGFANQMQAFGILQRHRMKATFYIINGGEVSRWCIGASRRYGDPLQPPGGCGDAYLNWDQIRTLDRSGLITIGGHTLDHANLAALPAEEQRHEIIDSKLDLERQLGHSIRHFAYPYGAYNQTSIEIVREAGYQTAVTTLPGMVQEPGTEFTLRRERDALALP